MIELQNHKNPTILEEIIDMYSAICNFVCKHKATAEDVEELESWCNMCPLRRLYG